MAARSMAAIRGGQDSYLGQGFLGPSGGYHNKTGGGGSEYVAMKFPLSTPPLGILKDHDALNPKP